MRFRDINSGCIFEYISESRNYSGLILVNLRNEISGRIESFNKATYKYFFKVI